MWLRFKNVTLLQVKNTLHHLILINSVVKLSDLMSREVCEADFNAHQFGAFFPQPKPIEKKTDQQYFTATISKQYLCNMKNVLLEVFPIYSSSFSLLNETAFLLLEVYKISFYASNDLI